MMMAYITVYLGRAGQIFTAHSHPMLDCAGTPINPLRNQCSINLKEKR